MAAARSVVSSFIVTGEFGTEIAREQLRSIVARHGSLFPDDHHGDAYHRMMLTGAKPMHLACFVAFLARIIRTNGSLGREMVRRVVNSLLSQFGMVAVDAPGFAQRPKSIDEEQAEAHLASAHFTVLVEEAQRFGDDGRIRAAKKAGDRAIAEIADVQRAIEATA